ncbi:pyridoxal 5'-phosphate synthase lyase subunit PdxS [Candidatus Micrarchaeota archaeon]|nr:pyridoxal 5'-phosphate synthase lyase subunit PdxS [Candidatus Micrarchaeota archaeon]
MQQRRQRVFAPQQPQPEIPLRQAQPQQPSSPVFGTFDVKSGLAQMLKGGVIMDVTNAAQARIAEDAGAVAVMALERVPSDIRKDGGVARMSDPLMIKEILASVSIPVMAKCRIGHFAEAQILQSLNVDFIDESEVLTPADEQFHINKHEFTVPFVCGCKNLGEALRRIHEGAAMMRTKGEAGTGNIVEAIRHIRAVNSSIASLANRRNVEYERMAQEMRVPYQLVLTTAKLGRLPVVNFAAGGIATPADASMCMQLGCDGVFVGSGIFKSSEPEKRAEAIVNAVANFADARALAKASEGIGEAMRGLDVKEIPHQNRFSFRGV